MNTWFTSDTHYNHKNIVRGTSTWDKFEEGSSHQSCRDFDTLEKHNSVLVDNFNALVKPEDTLWHLGDVAFGGHQNIKTFMDRLNCKNVHLIFGNHDQHIEPLDSIYRPLFASCQYYKELSFGGSPNKVKFILFHFAQRVWNKGHHGAIHLYGHSHGTLPGVGKSMDVGVDTNDYKPYHLDTIRKIMEKRETLIVDHHNAKTN